MRIVGLHGLRSPSIIEGVTQVTIFDDENQAVALVHSPSPGVCILTDITSPDFYRLLKEYQVHVDKKPVVHNG